jgi:hypothetical protein
MTFLFNDQSFSFETLRALGYTSYGGADIGEVTSTASRIPDGDENAWYSEWRALAERISRRRRSQRRRRAPSERPRVLLAGQQLLPDVRVLPSCRLVE